MQLLVSVSRGTLCTTTAKVIHSLFFDALRNYSLYTLCNISPPYRSASAAVSIVTDYAYPCVISVGPLRGNSHANMTRTRPRYGKEHAREQQPARGCGAGDTAPCDTRPEIEPARYWSASLLCALFERLPRSTASAPSSHPTRFKQLGSRFHMTDSRREEKRAFFTVLHLPDDGQSAGNKIISNTGGMVQDF